MRSTFREWKYTVIIWTNHGRRRGSSRISLSTSQYVVCQRRVPSGSLIGFIFSLLRLLFRIGAKSPVYRCPVRQRQQLPADDPVRCQPRSRAHVPLNLLDARFRLLGLLGKSEMFTAADEAGPAR